MNGKELLEIFEARKARMIDSIIELVEIESPSRDAAGISEVAGKIETLVHDISPEFKSERISAGELGGHLLIRVFGEKTDAGKLLILGHIDTVHPRGSKEKNPTRIENGRLFGGGSFDMKANIAVVIEILRVFIEQNLLPRKTITLLLSCDEEIGSPTGREIVEREAGSSDACLVCEPSADGKVKTGRKGTGMYRLKAHGIPSHAGLEPEKGASAILELARQIPLVHDLNDAETGTTANVCTIKGGTTSNVIPEFAECEIDVRFSKLSEAEKISDAIARLRSFDDRVALEIIGGINRPPLERTEKVVELFRKARKLAAEFDYDLEETQVGGASDGNFVGALGVPVLDGLGIRGSGAHTLNEFIYTDDIAKRATLIARLLLEL